MDNLACLTRVERKATVSSSRRNVKANLWRVRLLHLYAYLLPGRLCVPILERSNLLNTSRCEEDEFEFATIGPAIRILRSLGRPESKRLSLFQPRVFLVGKVEPAGSIRAKVRLVRSKTESIECAAVLSTRHLDGDKILITQAVDVEYSGGNSDHIYALSKIRLLSWWRLVAISATTVTATAVTAAPMTAAAAVTVIAATVITATVIAAAMISARMAVTEMSAAKAVSIKIVTPIVGTIVTATVKFTCAPPE